MPFKTRCSPKSGLRRGGTDCSTNVLKQNGPALRTVITNHGFAGNRGHSVQINYNLSEPEVVPACTIFGHWGPESSFVLAPRMGIYSNFGTLYHTPSPYV